MILVDSSVIIDVLTRDATWGVWSEAALIDAANRDEIAINPSSMLRSPRVSQRWRRTIFIWAKGSFAGSLSPTGRALSRDGRLSNIAVAAAYGRLRSRISISELTRLLQASRC